MPNLGMVICSLANDSYQVFSPNLFPDSKPIFERLQKTASIGPCKKVALVSGKTCTDRKKPLSQTVDSNLMNLGKLLHFCVSLVYKSCSAVFADRHVPSLQQMQNIQLHLCQEFV